MSKYDPLSARLTGDDGREWSVTFADLEKLLGFSLPKTARSGKTWWRNTGAQPHQQAWVSSGWEVAQVDLAGARVTFRRITASAPDVLQKHPTPVGADQPAILERLEASSKWGVVALVTGGLALVAGLGALAIRGVMRRK
jgi:hypothetical protein